MIRNASPFSQRLVNLTLAYASSFLALIITLWLGKIMPDGEFAVVVLGLAIGTFTSLVANLGTNQTLVRDFMKLRAQEDQSRLLHANLARTAGAAGAMLLGGLVVALIHGRDISHMIALATLIGWATLRGLLPTAWYDLTGRIWLQNLLNLLERLGTMGALGVLCLLPSDAITAATVGLLLFTARLVSVAAQHAVWWSLERTEFPFQWMRLSAKYAAGTSTRVCVTFLANGIASYGTQIILYAYGSASQMAAYGIAFQVLSMVVLFQGQSLRFVVRAIADACRAPSNVHASMARHSLSMGGCSLLLAFGAAGALCALPIWLDQPAYQMLPQFALPLCAWVVLVGVGQVVTQHLLCLHLENHYLAVGVAGGFVAVGLGLWLIPLYGPIAAAYVLLAVQTLRFGANLGSVFWEVRRLRQTPVSPTVRQSRAA